MKFRIAHQLLLASAILLTQATYVSPASATITRIADDPTRNLVKADRLKISFETWVQSPTAIYLKRVESNNNCKATGSKGKYQGTWQMNAGFWKTYGGLKYAKS